jgi:hypothetical protein
MSVVLNPLHDKLTLLFSNLNRINGLLKQLERYLNSHEKLVQSQLADKNYDVFTCFSGSTLLITDLSEQQDDVCRTYYPTEVFAIEGKEYFDYLEILIQRESAWSISQGYESFEKFLYDIAAVFMFNNQNFSEQKMLKKKKEKPLITYENYRELVKLSYNGKRNEDIFNFFREITKLKSYEKHNNLTFSTLS